MSTRTPGRRPRRIVVLAAAVLVPLAACSKPEATAAQARDVMMATYREAGVDDTVANCVVDKALQRHEPGELVNRDGTASAEVTQSVADIQAECIVASTPTTTVPPTTVPETTVPPTTVPETTVPPTTEPDVDVTAFCATSEEVAISLLAADYLPTDSSTAVIEAYFADLIDNVELAVATAPNAEFAEKPKELKGAVGRFIDELEGVGYDLSAVDEDVIDEEGDTIDALQADLDDFIESQCDSSTDIDGEAEELADRLINLYDTGETESDSITAESDDGRMIVDVPATWTSQTYEQLDNTSTFIVGIDAAAYPSSWTSDGLRLTVTDAVSDFVPLMDASSAATECTFVSEEAYDDTVYIGTLRYYEACGGDSEAIVLGALDVDNTMTVLLEVQMVELDQAVIDGILSTFLT